MAKNYMQLEEMRRRRKRSRKTKGKPSRGPESLLQERCVSWFRAMYPRYEQLLFSIPNGGFRTAEVGEVMKREGMMRGVADVLLLVANKEYHGLAIEFKVGKNRLSKEQEEWAAVLVEQGYQYAVIRGFEGFRELVIRYLEDV